MKGEQPQETLAKAEERNMDKGRERWMCSAGRTGVRNESGQKHRVGRNREKERCGEMGLPTLMNPVAPSPLSVPPLLPSALTCQDRVTAIQWRQLQQPHFEAPSAATGEIMTPPISSHHHRHPVCLPWLAHRAEGEP